MSNKGVKNHPLMLYSFYVLLSSHAIPLFDHRNWYRNLSRHNQPRTSVPSH